MVHTELEFAKAMIKRMNTGSMKLDEILGSQEKNLSKIGIGYIHRASTSKDKGKSFFVQGPTMFSMTPTFHNALPMKYVNAKYKHVPHNKFTPTCHFCGVKGHIRPHCNKLRNLLRNQQRKKHYSPQ